MAEIISMSLNDELLKEMDELQRELGFEGRSEMIRAALRMLIADKKENTKMKGVLDAILLTIHDDKYTKDVSVIRHKYQDIIKTQVHNHLRNHKCLEIFVLNGEAEKIKDLQEKMQTNKKIEFSKLFVS